MPTNTSESGLNVALRVVLIAIYLLGSGFFVYGSLTAPTALHPIAVVYRA
jgi:hypothetical protein